jgi:hypothetical protein
MESSDSDSSSNNNNNNNETDVAKHVPKIFIKCAKTRGRKFRSIKTILKSKMKDAEEQCDASSLLISFRPSKKGKTIIRKANTKMKSILSVPFKMLVDETSKGKTNKPILDVLCDFIENAIQREYGIQSVKIKPTKVHEEVEVTQKPRETIIPFLEANLGNVDAELIRQRLLSDMQKKEKKTHKKKINQKYHQSKKRKTVEYVHVDAEVFKARLTDSIVGGKTIVVNGRHRGVNDEPIISRGSDNISDGEDSDVANDYF